MNRFLKGFFTLLISCVLLVSLTACNDKDNNVSNNNNKQEEQSEKNNNLGIGKYKVEKKGNSVLVLTNDGNAISTTEYKFSNNVLTEAVLTQKFSSSSMAKTMYDTIKNETSITNQYVDLKVSGDTITMNYKTEILSAYTGMDKDALYNLMIETYSTYME